MTKHKAKMINYGDRKRRIKARLAEMADMVITDFNITVERVNLETALIHKHPNVAEVDDGSYKKRSRYNRKAREKRAERL